MIDAMTILTAVLVLITAIYAYLTHRMVKASEASVRLMKAQADAISRPYVSISLVKQSNNPFIFLRVENTGETTARDMTLNLGPEFEKVQHLQGPKELKASYLFIKTLASFPPRSPVFFLLGLGASFMADDKTRPQQTFSIIAKYSFSGQTVNETTWLDVNQYNSTSLETDPVVDVLNKIKDELAKKK